MNPWIGVDLDGTLAEYDRWRGVEHIGAPIPAMVERVKRWLAEGHEVRIFTARISGERGIIGGAERTIKPDESRLLIERWCQEHLGQVLKITCMKDFGMIELWDDRAVQVEANTGKRVGFSRRGLD